MNKESASMKTIQLRLPYLIFLGDIEDPTLAKTGAGLVQWCGEDVVGQLRLPGCPISLGLEDVTIDLAVTFGAKSLVIGVATVGGTIKESWLSIFAHALEMGMDVVNGLHTDLCQFPELVEAQARGGGKIINIRQSPALLPIGHGAKRMGKRLLTVGTDCAVGKKYTALAMTQALSNAGVKATFRATGQTGIMIAGEGIPLDCVVSDFLSGAAEIISPNNEPDHWDIIEGQGSLFNPSFSGVSMGLLHGSQPDALILCHDAARQGMSTCPEFGMPSLSKCMELHLACARIVNPAVRFIGISINTSSLSEEAGKQYLDKISEETGLICVDPIRQGCHQLADALLDEAHS